MAATPASSVCAPAGEAERLRGAIRAMQQPGYLHQAYPDIVYPHDVESGPNPAPADLSATEQGKAEDTARFIPPRSLRSKPWQSECSLTDLCTGQWALLHCTAVASPMTGAQSINQTVWT